MTADVRRTQVSTGPLGGCCEALRPAEPKRASDSSQSEAAIRSIRYTFLSSRIRRSTLGIALHSEKWVCLSYDRCGVKNLKEK